MNNDLPLAPADYRRIYETVHGVITAARGQPHRSCTLFAAAGAILLGEHYGLEATFAAGVAVFNLDGLVPICFGRRGTDCIVADAHGYHAWVEVGDFAIDFMSPLLPDVALELGAGPSPRRSFQMPLAASNFDSRAHGTRGAFALGNDSDVARAVLRGFDANPIHSELLEACVRWFVKPPEQMGPEQVRLSNGKTLHLHANAPAILGEWRDLVPWH